MTAKGRGTSPETMRSTSSQTTNARAAAGKLRGCPVEAQKIFLREVTERIVMPAHGEAGLDADGFFTGTGPAAP